MDSKILANRLQKLGYTLGKDIFGWIVISNSTGFEWKFPTLGGVNRFVTDVVLSRYKNRGGDR